MAVIRQGERNSGDGPDFKKAEIRIGGLRFYGDVELHLRPEDWNRHGHHNDRRYNQVVLHVVLSGEEKEVVLADDTPVPCLMLQPYMPARLDDVLNYAAAKPDMVCSGMLHHLSPRVIEKQIDRVHRSYFEYRTEHLMKYFDPALPPYRAWKNMLATGLCEGLGFSRNKAPMVELCSLLLTRLKGDEEPEAVITRARELSGLADGLLPPAAMAPAVWDFSASRPANQPPVRIAQAARLLYVLFRLPVDKLLPDGSRGLWKHLMIKGIGPERRSILFSTVYLPALYIFGSLFHHQRLMHDVLGSWRRREHSLPASVRKAYEKNGVPGGRFHRKLGAVYQYRHRCRKGVCQSCSVMQKLLQA